MRSVTAFLFPACHLQLHITAQGALPSWSNVGEDEGEREGEGAGEGEEEVVMQRTRLRCEHSTSISMTRRGPWRGTPETRGGGHGHDSRDSYVVIPEDGVRERKHRRIAARHGRLGRQGDAWGEEVGLTSAIHVRVRSIFGVVVAGGLDKCGI